MATARYVIMVPHEVEAEVIGNDDMMTEWGRQIAESYPEVHSMNPSQEDSYPARMVEAVRLGEPDSAPTPLDELVTPGFAA